MLPSAEVLPPAKRGDVYRAREKGSTRILVVDGAFAHELPITPREVVDVARDGAQIFGASSMGAIRAAECRPAGVRGVGAVYRMYRMGLLDSDDPVAVATDPDQGHAAVSVALINIHAAVGRLRGLRMITPSQRAALLQSAAALYYPDRTWRLILRQAGVNDPDGALRRVCAAVDIKRADALSAVRLLASLPDPAESDSTFRALDRGPRYFSHDPLLGYDRRRLDDDLPRFIAGSGRYRKYVRWLVADEPEFHGIAAKDCPTSPRDPLVEKALARVFRSRRGIACSVMDKVASFGQFETEVMLWHAVLRLKADRISHGVEVSPGHERQVRDGVAQRHGYRTWESLTSDLRDGRLPSGIPFDWVEEACVSLVHARA
ncbi:TfuA-like protein [Streptomyces sp. NPDC014894]|uniref:TfuA-like protein n=1 Tax=Streptomyces sp. NPDC014894 TaxID=3364931 RepID=UPI003702958D